MNGGEGSDEVVVPMKETNNVTEKTAGVAEFVEGRTPTNEDTGQDHTFPAQYGQGVSQELTGGRQVAYSLRVDVISEGGAVCGSAARTDLCEGGQRWLSDGCPHRDLVNRIENCSGR